MHEIVGILFLKTWWRYSRDADDVFSAIYHWFNILEGCAWLVFAGLVLRRYLVHRRSGIELWYAAAFFTFALTDFREAWVQQSWLIWLKLVNLIALFYLRSIVMTRYYSTSKLY